MGAQDRTSRAFRSSFRKGTELLHRGKPEQAVSYLQQAAELRPEHVDASLNLSGAYILTGRFKLAIPLLEALSEREPNNAMIWTNLGAAYLGNPILAKAEEQEAAIEAFKQALTIDPAAPSAAYNLGLIYRDRREIGQAIRWFKQAVQANPADEDARRLHARMIERRKKEGRER